MKKGDKVPEEVVKAMKANGWTESAIKQHYRAHLFCHRFTKSLAAYAKVVDQTEFLACKDAEAVKNIGIPIMNDRDWAMFVEIRWKDVIR